MQIPSSEPIDDQRKQRTPSPEPSDDLDSTLESVKPHPSAAPRKASNRGRKRGSTSILTDEVTLVELRARKLAVETKKIVAKEKTQERIRIAKAKAEEKSRIAEEKAKAKEAEGRGGGRGGRGRDSSDGAGCSTGNRPKTSRGLPKTATYGGH